MIYRMSIYRVAIYTPRAPRLSRPRLQSPAMTSTRRWDRAADLLPVPCGRRRDPSSPRCRPTTCRPSRAVHVHARRRAPLRHPPDADRGAQRSTSPASSSRRRGRGLRHPSDARVTTSRAGAGDDARQLRASGSPTARPSGPTAPRTSSARSGRSGAPSSASAAGESATCPARAGSTRPLTALPMETLPETFVHPAGYCQNVLATGDCRDRRASTQVGGREAIVVECRHPRTIEMAADRPDFRIRDRGRPGGRRDPPARGVDRRRRHPRRAGHRVRSRTRRSARPRSTSPSRPGRRCSTESGRRGAAGPSTLARITRFSSLAQTRIVRARPGHRADPPGPRVPRRSRMWRGVPARRQEAAERVRARRPPRARR